jgi:hypothetical protein
VSSPRHQKHSGKKKHASPAAEAANVALDFAGKNLKTFGIFSLECSFISLLAASAALKSAWTGVNSFKVKYRKSDSFQTKTRKTIAGALLGAEAAHQDYKSFLKQLSPHEKLRYRQSVWSVLVASVAVGGFLKANNSFNPAEKPGDPSVAPVASFRPDHVLVLCANTEQYRLVIHGYEDGLGDGFAGMAQVQSVERNKCAVVNIRIRNDNSHRTVPHLVINAEGLDENGIRNIIRQNNFPDKFKVIAARGHTGDMPDLLNLSENFEDKKCLRMLGGCNAAHFIPQYHRESEPITGSQYRAYAPRNNGWGILTVEALEKSRTWAEVQEHVFRGSNAAREELILPGSEKYTELVESYISES